MTANNNPDFNSGFYNGIGFSVITALFMSIVLIPLICISSYYDGVHQMEKGAISSGVGQYKYDEKTDSIIFVYDQKTPTAEANPK